MNYLEEMKDDIREYIDDNVTREEWANDRQGLESTLYDDLFIDDSVTGNASGSYTMSAYQAEENVAHNLDLLAEACSEFGCNMDLLKDGAEACDVTIRCYLLGQALSEVLDDLENEGYFEEEKVSLSDFETYNDLCCGRDCDTCPLWDMAKTDKDFDCEEYFNSVKEA